MNRVSRMLVGVLTAGLVVSGVVLAQDSFDESVDPSRFRKGNPDWDTQELLARGLSALHQEHQQILKEMEELRAEIRSLRTLRERKQ